jgi:hypothetical protein
MHNNIVFASCASASGALQLHIGVASIALNQHSDSRLEGLLRLLVLAYRLAYEAFLAFLRDDGWAIASHISLSALMSLFPFLIFMTALTSALYGSDELAEKLRKSCWTHGPRRWRGRFPTRFRMC